MLDLNVSMLDPNVSMLEPNVSVLDPNVSMLDPNVSVLDPNSGLPRVHSRWSRRVMAGPHTTAAILPLPLPTSR